MPKKYSDEEHAKKAAYANAWRLKHLERIQAYERARYAVNPEKKRARAQSYRLANPEKYRAKDAAYRLKNLEKLRAYDAARYVANPARVTHTPEQSKANNATYRRAHPEKVRARKAADRIANIDEYRARDAAYRAAHPEQMAEYGAARRARKANAPINDFTAAQWREMQAAYDHRCVYCGKRAKGHLTQDHILALSQGGSHTLSNIVPACRSCNSRKGTRPPPIPVQPLLLLDGPL